jgi:transcriptional regulator with XRE-family HTH domain
LNEIWVKQSAMISSIAQLRKKLNIRQVELGLMMGRSRSLMNHFEHGRAMESGARLDLINALHRLVDRVSPNATVNPYLNEAEAQQAASEYEAQVRSHSQKQAQQFSEKLNAMEDEYQQLIQSMRIWAAIINEPDCPPEVHQWIGVVTAQLTKRARKCNPLEQSKLRLQRDAHLGKAQGHE